MEASEVIMLMAIVALTVSQSCMVMRVSRHLDQIDALFSQCVVEAVEEAEEEVSHD